MTNSERNVRMAPAYGLEITEGQAAYGLEITEDQAVELKRGWLWTWPKMQAYLGGDRDQF